MSPSLPESERDAPEARDGATDTPPAGPKPRPRARRLVSAVARGVAGAALSLAAFYVTAYFAVNSSAANAWLARALLGRAPRDAVTVQRAQWGPRPAWVWLVEPRGHAPDDRESLRAQVLGLRLTWSAAHPLKPRPTAFAATNARVLDRGDKVALHAAHVQAELARAPRGQTRLARVRVDGFTVDLAWDARGRSSVRRSFRLRKPRGPEQPPTVAPRPTPAPPKPAFVVHLDDIALRHGTVRLRWPHRSLRFTEVQALGAVTVGGPDGLTIRADARAQGSSLTEGRGARSRRLAVTRVAIDGFHWRGEGFQGRRAVLTGAEGAPPLADVTVSLSQTTRPGAGRDASATPALRIQGDAHLPPDTLTAWLGQAVLPGGATVEGLDLTARGAALTFRVRAAAPAVRAGAWRAQGVRGRAAGDVTLGALIPTGNVTLRDVDVDALQGAQGVSLEAAHVGRVEARVATAATVTVREARAGVLTLPAGQVSNPEVQGDLKLGLRGGDYTATLKSPTGQVTLRGTLGLELLLGKRLTFEGTAQLAGLRGPLAAMALQRVRADLGGGATTLTPPLSGQLRFRGEVKPGRGLALVPHASWDDGRLEDSSGRSMVRQGPTGRWSLEKETR